MGADSTITTSNVIGEEALVDSIVQQDQKPVILSDDEVYQGDPEEIITHFGAKNLIGTLKSSFKQRGI